MSEIRDTASLFLRVDGEEAIKKFSEAKAKVKEFIKASNAGDFRQVETDTFLFLEYYYYLYNTKENRYDTGFSYTSQLGHVGYSDNPHYTCHNILEKDWIVFVKSFANTFDVSDCSYFRYIWLGTQIC